MKIEIVVDKDNTHFTYMVECDKVIDGSYATIRSARLLEPHGGDGKLVLLKKTNKEFPEHYDKEGFETIAVFTVWTFWNKIHDDAEKCERCARYRSLDKDGYCPECAKHAERARSHS